MELARRVLLLRQLERDPGNIRIGGQETHLRRDHDVGCQRIGHRGGDRGVGADIEDEFDRPRVDVATSAGHHCGGDVDERLEGGLDLECCCGSADGGRTVDRRGGLRTDGERECHHLGLGGDRLAQRCACQLLDDDRGTDGHGCRRGAGDRRVDTGEGDELDEIWRGVGAVTGDGGVGADLQQFERRFHFERCCRVQRSAPWSDRRRSA